MVKIFLTVIKSFDTKSSYICSDRRNLSKGRLHRVFVYASTGNIYRYSKCFKWCKNVLSVGLTLRELRYNFKRKVPVVPTLHRMRLKTRKALLILSIDLCVTLSLSLVQFLRSRMAVPALVDPPLRGCSTSLANHRPARMAQADCS